MYDPGIDGIRSRQRSPQYNLPPQFSSQDWVTEAQEAGGHSHSALETVRHGSYLHASRAGSPDLPSSSRVTRDGLVTASGQQPAWTDGRRPNKPEGSGFLRRQPPGG